MIRSMTGFGDASITLDDVHYTLEVRSLNNKYLKVMVRLPEDLQPLEAALEAHVRRRITRGSVTITGHVVDTSEAAAHEINTQALEHYLDQIMNVPQIAEGALRVDVASLLGLPGILQQPADDQARIERACEALLKLLDQACDQLVSMREREGLTLHEDLMSHHATVQSRLAEIAQRAPDVVAEYQTRLEERIRTLLADRAAQFDPADLIREVAVFAEKSDIAEEVTRLSGHMDQFRDLLADSSDKPMGRTLDFLAQEMLREANTIASKSGDARISRLIVEIKGAIDRIKEQVQNVE
ncbi:MAG: YicC family protein [Phycisphaerales bacterium]|nr:YicC family protein [Phycisphaerales bacterium]